MKTVPAKEIKRRGIGALDELLCEGPVHVIQFDEPKYVVMTEAHYAWLMEEAREAELARIREAMEDVAAGRVTVYEDVEELIRDLHDEP